MSVARITEISASSNESFEDAIKQGKRAPRKRFMGCAGLGQGTGSTDRERKNFFLQSDYEDHFRAG